MSKILPPITTRFILINTLKKDNIGSSARAIKTMGFDSLSLVNPQRIENVQNDILQCKKVKNRASGADNVLRNINIYSSLDEAVQGCNLICGTGMPVSMHRKRLERDYTEPRVYFDQLLRDIQYINDDAVDLHHHHHRQQLDIAFLFGCETTGMKEDDMEACHVMLGIPTNPKFGSLNLASAVQIIAYDWRMALGWSLDKYS